MDIAGYSGLELIGRGGFSTVYRAHQSAHSRDVALKVLSVDVSDPAARARFERECAANGRLGSHPNVLTIYESGYTEDGKPYIAMELCTGGSLADQVASSGPLPVEAVLRIGVRIAGAVETAHRNGITHRDIKPENILTTAYGEHVLADFGISVLDNTRSGTATAGSFTLSHVPPEVLQGEVSGVPGDVYALGSTLYRLLTGRPPFADESTALAVAITRTLNDPVPDPGAHVPASLRRALEESMAKDPARRPGSAVAFAEMLRDVQREIGLSIADPVVAAIPAGPPDAAQPVPAAGPVTSNPTVSPTAPVSPPDPVTPTDVRGDEPSPTRMPSAPGDPAPRPASGPERTEETGAVHEAGSPRSRRGLLVGAAAAALLLVAGGAVVVGSGSNGTGGAVDVVDTTSPVDSVAEPSGDSSPDDTATVAGQKPVTTTVAGGKASGSGSKTPTAPTAPKITTAPKATSQVQVTTAPAAAGSVDSTSTTAAPAAATTTTVRVSLPTIAIPNLSGLGCLTRETCAQALYDAWKANDVTAARKAAILTNNSYPAVTSMFAYPFASYGGGWPSKVTQVSAQVYQVTSTRSATPKSWTFLFNYDTSSYKVALVATG